MSIDLLKMYESANPEEMKDYYARMLKQGRPIYLYPRIAKEAKAIGLEEGVHFLAIEALAS